MEVYLGGKTLEVSPPPYINHIFPDQGLILYRVLDENEAKDTSQAEYTSTQTQINLMQSMAYGTPITLEKAGIAELVITMSVIVVAGVTTTICLVAAAPVAAAAAQVAAGTATPGVVSTVTQAIGDGLITTIVIDPCLPYILELMNQRVA